MQSGTLARLPVFSGIIPERKINPNTKHKYQT